MFSTGLLDLGLDLSLIELCPLEGLTYVLFLSDIA